MSAELRRRRRGGTGQNKRQRERNKHANPTNIIQHSQVLPVDVGFVTFLLSLVQ